MASKTERDKPEQSRSDRATAKADSAPKENAHNPAWANGLKQLYDSVVDEPIPDSFSDLLAQFNEEDDADDPANEAGGIA